jgi:hypothetical protein
MSFPIHRNTDKRSCGAQTIAIGQSTVFINGLLASVEGDPNTHKKGELLATMNDGSIFINNKKVVMKGSASKPDLLHLKSPALGASPNVYASGGKGPAAAASAGATASQAAQSGGTNGSMGGGGVSDPAVQRNADGSPVDGDKNADGEVNQADRNFDDGSSPGYPSDLSNAELEQLIRDEATLRGIDPNTAVAIYRAEGAGSYQSSVRRNGSGSLNGREASFGPYQLYTGGGMGNDYENATGRTLTQDNTRDGVTNQVRYALDKAATGGWGPWYGRGPAGVGEFEGVGGAQAIGNWN